MWDTHRHIYIYIYIYIYTHTYTHIHTHTHTYIYNGILFGLYKGGNPTICNNISELGRCHAN